MTVSWRSVLVILWIVQFLVTMATTLGLTFVPFYLEKDPFLAVTVDADRLFYTSLILAGPFFTTLIATPFWGWMGDRTGHKKQVLRAIVGLGITQLLMGFATSPLQLVLIRMLQGMVSGVIAANLGLLSAITPEEHQGRAISILQSSNTVGLVLGPMIGGTLAHALGFRPVYWLIGGVILLTTLVSWWWLPADAERTGTTKMSDTATASDTTKMSDTATASDTTKMSNTATASDTTKMSDTATVPDTTKMSDTATASDAAKVSDTATASDTTKTADTWRPSANPFVALWIAMGEGWRNLSLRVAFGILMLGNFAWTLSQAVFAIYAGKLITQAVAEGRVSASWWSQDLVFVSICMSATGVMSFAMSFVWGRLHDAGERHLMSHASLMIAVGSFLLVLWPPWGWVLFARFVMGGGLSGLSSLPYAVISTQVAASERSKYMGLGTSMIHLGNLGGFLLGGVVARMWGESSNFLLTAVICVWIIVLSWRTSSPKQQTSVG
ncbi:MFS transporter [Myxococcota bacterium]|nr:MFS transporter [Myxococcota bacterium]